jgi:hypothetical protein
VALPAAFPALIATPALCLPLATSSQKESRLLRLVTASVRATLLSVKMSIPHLRVAVTGNGSKLPKWPSVKSTLIEIPGTETAKGRGVFDKAEIDRIPK